MKLQPSYVRVMIDVDEYDWIWCEMIAAWGCSGIGDDTIKEQGA